MPSFFTQLNIWNLTLIVLMFSTSCQVQENISKNNACSTNYPIILVHGILMRDNLPVVKYWSGIPKALEKQGAKVYLANTKAFASHVENALILQDRIYEVLEETGAKKVNLITHSKGGIESRYLITKLEMADKVASLTTIATPHRGSSNADALLLKLHQNGRLNKIMNYAKIYAELTGEKSPDPHTATKELTIKYMENFNQSVPDHEDVYYQSFGSIASPDYPLWVIRNHVKSMLEKEGPGDGTVSLKSCQWGNFRGIVESDQDYGVSHFDIVGMKFVSKQSTFDANDFIVYIASDLKCRGF